MPQPGHQRIRRLLLRAPIPFRRRFLHRAWRIREWMISRRASPGANGPTPDGGSRGPLPPPALRVLVAGDAGAGYFLESGREQMSFFVGLLERHGIDPAAFADVLDFGCGCGRLARWWPLAPGQNLQGCDYNPRLVEWCQGNLPFMRATLSALGPPLPYADRSFDFIYALSVFTHLAEEHQRPWIDELARVLKPGGVLLFTASGTAYGNHLSAEERERFRAGRLITHFTEVEGTNLCAAYHPRSYVEGKLLTAFDPIEVIEPGQDPSASIPLLVQDTYLCRLR